MQIGPSFRYYTSDSPIGSLYFQGTLVYVKFQENITINDLTNSFSRRVDGKGIGLIISFGYSYLVSDWVIFDIGLNYDTNWIDTDLESPTRSQMESENFTLGGITYSFGFNILINEFFF
jgi:hypothetical protein